MGMGAVTLFLGTGLLNTLTHPGAALGLFYGLLFGFLFAILGPASSSWLTRPRLFIEGHRPELDPDPDKGGRFSCHAIAIRNFGRRCAESCIGLITFVDLKSDSVLTGEFLVRTQDAGLDPRKFNITDAAGEFFLLCDGNHREVEAEYLAWSALGNPRQMDIYPGTNMNLDIGRWFRGVGEDSHGERKPNQFQITSEEGWRSPRMALRTGPTERYQAVVSVAARNGRATKRGIEISFTLEDEKETVHLYVRHNYRDRFRIFTWKTRDRLSAFPPKAWDRIGAFRRKTRNRLRAFRRGAWDRIGAFRRNTGGRLRAFPRNTRDRIRPFLRRW
jgi:hypothetical protein